MTEKFQLSKLINLSTITHNDPWVQKMRGIKVDAAIRTLDGSFFDITALDRILSIYGMDDAKSSEDYQRLYEAHCVHYDAMDIEARRQLVYFIDRLLSLKSAEEHTDEANDANSPQNQ